MLKRLTFFVASVMMSVASFAQWTKPAAPAVQPMSVGEVVRSYEQRNSEEDSREIIFAESVVTVTNKH